MTDRDSAQPPIAALRSGYDSLVHRVEKMTAQELARTSGSSEWTVADVLSHLGSGAEINLAALDSALDIAPAPGEGYRESVWARWNALTPQEQADGFIASNAALVSRFEGLDAAQRADLRVDLGFLPEPVDVRTVALLRLNEFAHHRWDIEVVDDPAAALAADAVELLFTPMELFLGWIGHPDALDADRRTVLAVHTSDPDRSFGLDLRDQIALVDAPGDAAAATLTAPAEAFLRLTVGRLAPEHTPPGVRLDGAAITLDDLRRVFPGF